MVSPPMVPRCGGGTGASTICGGGGPLWSDGRNMLHPYGLARTYPSQRERGGFPLARE